MKINQPKFRGFDSKTNAWRYGFGFCVNRYKEEAEDDITLFTKKGPVYVETGSVGQYATTLRDKNGELRQLFDGDILRFQYKGEFNKWSRPMMIEWGGDDYPAFDLKGHAFDHNLLSLLVCSDEYEVEVLGNAYQQPELIH